jgi:hypothetical protein
MYRSGSHVSLWWINFVGPEVFSDNFVLLFIEDGTVHMSSVASLFVVLSYTFSVLYIT